MIERSTSTNATNDTSPRPPRRRRRSRRRASGRGSCVGHMFSIDAASGLVRSQVVEVTDSLSRKVDGRFLCGLFREKEIEFDRQRRNRLDEPQE